MDNYLLLSNKTLHSHYDRQTTSHNVRTDAAVTSVRLLHYAS